MALSAILEKTSLKIQHICQGGPSGLRLWVPPFWGNGRSRGPFRPLTPGVLPQFCSLSTLDCSFLKLHRTYQMQLKESQKVWNCGMCFSCFQTCIFLFGHQCETGEIVTPPTHKCTMKEMFPPKRNNGMRKTLVFATQKAL